MSSTVLFLIALTSLFQYIHATVTTNNNIIPRVIVPRLEVLEIFDIPEAPEEPEGGDPEGNDDPSGGDDDPGGSGGNDSNGDPAPAPDPENPEEVTPGGFAGIPKASTNEDQASSSPETPFTDRTCIFPHPLPAFSFLGSSSPRNQHIS